jgi:hypothetical protein
VRAALISDRVYVLSLEGRMFADASHYSLISLFHVGVNRDEMEEGDIHHK